MSRYFQDINIQNNLYTPNLICNNLSINNNISSNLIPSNNLLTLGSSSNPWNQVYYNSLTLISSSGTTLILSNSGIGELLITSPSGSFNIGSSGAFKVADYTQVAFNISTTIGTNFNSGNVYFDSFVATGTIPYNPVNGLFSLSAGNTYRISVAFNVSLALTDFFEFAVVKDDDTQLSKLFQAYITSPLTPSSNSNSGAVEFIYNPNTDTKIKIKIINDSGGNININPIYYNGCLIQQI